ncbi:hypothetical protein CRUP_034264 [Coryphaenoides rupestris]|nr:hypothetical protein CRUP_034264 [Coryphaenoides rupestris]
MSAMSLHLDAAYLLQGAGGQGLAYAGRRAYATYLPPPLRGHLGHLCDLCDCALEFEPAFIRKRNERERQRVRCVNAGYARLRDHLPAQRFEEKKRLSKVETLRAAIDYIHHLQALLELES